VESVQGPLIRDSDTNLVERSQAGDLRSFEQLVERYRDVVFRVVARVTGDDEADDVTQDVFLRAYHRLDRFRGEGPFRAWLLQIAHNAALSHAGRRRVGAVPLEVLEDDPPIGGRKTLADEVEGRERRRRLDTKVKGLSPHHRAVLVLRDIEGFSYDEIAQVTDTPVGSVKARLHRARGELIDVLRHNTYDWELPGER
jgi:RNA polymerase sigma-70 factor, ECF subfamily